MSGTFPPTLFASRRYAVLGLGRNGAAAARTLAAMGAQVQAWDDLAGSRAMLDDTPAVRVAEFTSLDGFDALVLSPGIPHTLPKPHPVAAMARAAGVPILSDAELLFEAVRLSGSKARFAGITGTNGKSTTTALLAHLLDSTGHPVAAGGNLGTAALALPLLGDDGTYVLEMSSYMLERLRTLRFDVACLLNLTPDHLDRHGDMAGYASAKLEIFARQQPGDTAVVAIDDAHGVALAARLPGCVTVSGRDVPADIRTVGTVLTDAAGPIADLAGITTLPGQHNAQNAAAAVALALALGVARDALPAALASYPGLPHRQQRVATIDGIAFINDSKATNADAAAWALGCYDRIVWIAGGVAKAGGIDTLAPFFPRIDTALLIGEAAPAFAETLAAHGVAHRIVDRLPQAVEQGFELARAHGVGVVLLSPACASFDQYPNFELRGTHFSALARLLEAERAV